MDPDELGFQHVFDDQGATDARYTAVLLHGTGADERDLLPMGQALAPGQPLLSPLGKVREQGRPRWFRRLEEGVFDEADLRKRAGELAAFLDRAREAYPQAPERYVAIGFSNGANIAASLLLLHPGALQGAVLLRAMTPLVPDALPGLDSLPVYVASGERDPLVPAEDVERLVEMLERAGADVTHRVADAGHGLDPSEIDPIRGWLADHETRFLEPPEVAE